MANPATSGPTATQLIAELRASAGEPIEGEFSLAEGAAQDKLSAFRYEDRTPFLVPLVEGLRVLGATKILANTSGGDLVVEATGVELPGAAAALGRLFAAAVSRDRSPPTWGLGRLGVAVDMARGIPGVDGVAIEAHDGDAGVLARWEGSSDAGLVHPLTASRSPTFRFILDAGTLREMRLAFGGEPAEISALQEAVEFDPLVTPVWWRGRVLSIAEPDLHTRLTRRGHGWTVVAGRCDEDGGAIVLRSEGVVVERIEAERGDVLAFVDLERPPRDLSQIQLVRDEIYDAAVAAARAAIDDLPRSSEPSPENRAAEEGQRTAGLSAVIMTGAILVAGALSEGWREVEKLEDRIGYERVRATLVSDTQFRYEVDGVGYRQARDKWELVMVTPGAGEPGEEFDIWVDETNPESVRLRSGLRGNLKVFALAAALILGLGAWALRGSRQGLARSALILVGAPSAAYAIARMFW